LLLTAKPSTRQSEKNVARVTLIVGRRLRIEPGHAGEFGGHVCRILTAKMA
jgi:hypothetical protein